MSPGSTMPREALIAPAASRVPPDGRLEASWPIGDVAQLGQLRRSVVQAACGQQQAENPEGAAADDEGLAGLEMRMALVVSELVANALRHGSPPRSLALHRVQRGWVVDVVDGATTTGPVAHGPDPTRAGQNGLQIVALLTEDWGWHVDGSCKHVWAIVPDGASGPPLHGPASRPTARPGGLGDARHDEAG